MKATRNLPQANKPKTPLVIPDRAMRRALTKFIFDASTGCHVSTYSGPEGYAQVGWAEGDKRRSTSVHRAAWAAVHGQIPEGMTIDHLCKNRRCVNPDHLRLLSNFENARRTQGRDWPLGYCRNGHRNDDHLYQEKGGRWRCRPCKQASRDRWMANNPDWKPLSKRTADK